MGRFVPVDHSLIEHAHRKARERKLKNQLEDIEFMNGIAHNVTGMGLYQDNEYIAEVTGVTPRLIILDNGSRIDNGLLDNYKIGPVQE